LALHLFDHVRPISTVSDHQLTPELTPDAELRPEQRDRRGHSFGHSDASVFDQQGKYPPLFLSVSVSNCCASKLFWVYFAAQAG
jgi:hypothetical protein